jgi:hypothetical protein
MTASPTVIARSEATKQSWFSTLRGLRTVLAELFWFFVFLKEEDCHASLVFTEAIPLFLKSVLQYPLAGIENAKSKPFPLKPPHERKLLIL